MAKEWCSTSEKKYPTPIPYVRQIFASVGGVGIMMSLSSFNRVR